MRDRAVNLYFTDFVDNRIRKIDRRGVISVVALAARLNFPTGLTLGRHGDLYVSDANNNRVLRISPDGKITSSPAPVDKDSAATAAPRPKRASTSPPGWPSTPTAVCTSPIRQ